MKWCNKPSHFTIYLFVCFFILTFYLQHSGFREHYIFWVNCTHTKI